MNSDRISGINEEELGKLALEILDYVDRISELFSKIDAEINKLPLSYKGNASTEFIGMYNDFSRNYRVVKENIKSYSDDLIDLLRQTRENDKALANLLDTNAEKGKADLKKGLKESEN